MATPKPVQGTDLADKSTTIAPQGSEQRLPVVQPPPAAPPPAQRKRRMWLWGAGVVLVAGLALGLYFQPWVTRPPLVAVETAALAPVTSVLAVNGRIAALHSVDVRALVGGTLESVLVTEGDVVQNGAELARIDAATQQAMLRQAVAGLDATLVAQAQAADTLARTQALGANIARNALDAAERAVQSAAQEVARTTALVDQAQLQLENFTIRAPMTGTVLALNIEPGQSIDPSTMLMTIADLEQLVVETDVDEAYATQIRTGLTAMMQLAGETAQRAGLVSFVAQQVDAATGGLALKLTFDEPVRAPIGLTVTTNIVVDSRSAALTAPRAAIQSGDAIFIVTDGTARRRPVTVIDWPAARLIVIDGLVPGDVVIVDSTGIIDGQAVRVDPR